MKKVSLILLAITAAFLCVMIGTLIGRHTSGNIYNVTEQSVSKQAADSSEAAVGKLNINTATLSEIEYLPGIGPTLAQRIIDYRTQNGPFESIDDLLLVNGIGEKRFNEIKDYITTGG